MPHFCLTRKLAAALHVKSPAVSVPSASPEHDWFADLFYVQGKKCVIWVHRSTLFPFVRPAVVAADLRDFTGLFRHELRGALEAIGLPELVERLDPPGPTTYAPTDDRAVVGSMLDHRKIFGFMVEDAPPGRVDVSAFNLLLSQTPMSAIGMETAEDRLKDLVGASRYRQ